MKTLLRKLLSPSTYQKVRKCNYDWQWDIKNPIPNLVIRVEVWLDGSLLVTYGVLGVHNKSTYSDFLSVRSFTNGDTVLKVNGNRLIQFVPWISNKALENRFKKLILSLFKYDEETKTLILNNVSNIRKTTATKS